MTVAITSMPPYITSSSHFPLMHTSYNVFTVDSVPNSNAVVETVGDTMNLCGTVVIESLLANIPSNRHVYVWAMP